MRGIEHIPWAYDLFMEVVERFGQEAEVVDVGRARGGGAEFAVEDFARDRLDPERAGGGEWVEGERHGWLIF